MPYTSSDRGDGRNRNPRPSGSSRGRGQRPRTNDARRRETGAPYRSNRNYRTMSGHDTGLNVRKNSNINFDRRRSRGRRPQGPLARFGIDNRMLLTLVAGVVIIIVFIFVVSSCVRSCSSPAEDTSTSATEVNSYDDRVAAGVSESLTNRFTSALDEGETLAWIAAHADEYADERLPELALRESTAIDFVASVPDADSTAGSYTEGTEQGSYPLLYDWDTRWGYVSYAGSIMGVTGSGPTTLSMAYMGATGENDQTPDVLAQLASEGGYADESTGTTSAFFTDVGGQIGLSVQELEPSTDNLSYVLANGQVAIVQLNASFTTPYVHWALVVCSNEDGSVTLYDPDSSEASLHTWAPGTITQNASILCAVSAGTQTTDSTGA